MTDSNAQKLRVMTAVRRRWLARHKLRGAGFLTLSIVKSTFLEGPDLEGVDL
jgi:hypothetical protein